MEKTSMRLILLFTMILVASCAANKREAQFGKTTTAELVVLKGQPLEEETIPLEGAKILIYEDDEKFQVENDVVTHSFRNPTTDESNLIYWKHAYKGCAATNEVISKETDGHQLVEYLMKCDAEGTGVIYKDQSDKISRIIQYEKK